MCLKEEDNMMKWLREMGAHDFTGVRAAAHWAEREEERRKRKAENTTDGAPPKVPKETTENV